MIIHQAVGMANPSKSRDALRQHREKCVAVFVVKEDGRLSIATGGNVVNRSGIFQA